MQKFKFSYDKENDDLFLYNPKSKSKGSVELGDLILDYNTKKEFVGMQIIGASKLLKDLLTDDLSAIKNVLGSLQDCKVDVKIKNNLLILKIFLFGKVKEIAPIISVPSIIESSPALAYV